MRTEERTMSSRPAAIADDASRRLLHAAEILSWLVVVSMALSGILTASVSDLLGAESAWAREAFRGGEMVSLLVAVPLLAGALIAGRRGSARAEAVWIGMLLYAAYNYAYAVFGTTFNDAFLVHIGAFSAAVFALACAMPALDYSKIAEAFQAAKATSLIGIFLVIVGIGQGLLWLFILARNALTGEVLHDIPVSGQHLVFALDLALLVPSLILAGVLLARRGAFGMLFGTAMAVMGAVYQVNLMTAGVYGEVAGVPGAKAFPPEGVILTTAFVVGALMLFLGGRHALGRATR